ncbi:radical SAM protein [Azospirillum sp. Sh1]|uniref:radical SAM protein n=1 Tax=Azospirillum sp. Sh1 TaxID=2607285 RepID=UPI0011EC2ACF|nr:radical SAM protein [Azospirillum sp. Sh1]KAA0571106.1 radical SAM protein [Azospirillum sp. Sh1]
MTEVVRVTHGDGKLPNLALMKIVHWHRTRGDDVVFTWSAERDLLDRPHYDRVYGSFTFSTSADKVSRFRATWPDAIIGGTGSSTPITVEQIIGLPEYEHYDYSVYPAETRSIGFTARGCRLSCKFCVVPTKEGRPRSVNTIADIWRGGDLPRHLILLDNDFFGQPAEQWRARIREIAEGGFRVCFMQGINTRLIDDEAAEALASIQYYDDGFKHRRLYTAWDNLKDEQVFFRGVERLERAGIRPYRLFVYMLVGFDKHETWARLFHRFNRMVERGLLPYPMVYGDRTRTLPLGGWNEPIEHRTLGEFQRWVIRGAYRANPPIPFRDYDVSAKGPRGIRHPQLFEEAA